MSDLLPFFAIILVSLTSFSLLVQKDWRITLALLALQYIGVFLLIAQIWPMLMAATKLIAGMMVCVLLAMALYHQQGEELVSNPSDPTSIKADRVNREMNPLFYLIAGILVSLVVLSQSLRLPEGPAEFSSAQAWGFLILIGLGLLKVGFSLQVFTAITGLLTALSGFEILYALIDPSISSAGFLALISLGLGVTGAYLISAPTMEESE